MTGALTTILPLAQGYGPRSGGWDSWHMMGGGVPFGGLFIVLLVVAAVFAVVIVLGKRSGKPDSPAESHQQSALELLKRRYAAGEIDREEFERIRDDIT